MDKLILENVRCFQGHHELPLAPLTLLIGENSTGKSTVLASARIATNICRGGNQLNFNEEPFDWGAYDQIANTCGGRRGRAKAFTIGCEYKSSDISQYGDKVMQVRASCEEKNAQPKLSQWQIAVNDDCIVVDLTDDENATATLVTRGKECRRTLKAERMRQGAYYYLAGVFHEFAKLDKKQNDFFDCAFALLNHALAHNYSYAFAPIRTRPRRTYDRRADTPRPEGEHVPMVLARLKASEPKKWKELKDELTEFGKECGLFKSVNVKSLGKESDPFQVQITVNGSPTNLIDVGYGVSQAIPLLVDCLEESNHLLLIQQPEVHLHPRAQAQLGSFFGYLVRKQQKQFIVETHSDYLVDRIRMDVRDGRHGLRPEDVQILYFERKDSSVSVHPMQIDECGNLLNAPPSYRRFFLDEEKRFLGG